MAKFLGRLSKVREQVGFSRSEIYRLISLGRFPRPIPLGQRAVAWDMDEVEVWVQERIASRDAKPR